MVPRTCPGAALAAGPGTISCLAVGEHAAADPGRGCAGLLQPLLETCPDIPALAACPPEVLNKLWQGLGYYTRVRNLQKAAQCICRDYGGEFPRDIEAIRALPGIGPYTAGGYRVDLL